MTPEDLIKILGISLAQAALTLKAKIRKLVRFTSMPLARRYRVDLIFMVKRLWCKMNTDTMDGRYKSIHENRSVKCWVIKTSLLKHILYTINNIVVLLWTSSFEIIAHLI